MGKTVTTTSKQRRSSSSRSGSSTTGSVHRTTESSQQGVPAHLKKHTQEEKHGPITGCDDSTPEHANVKAKMESGALGSGQTIDPATLQKLAVTPDQDNSKVKVHTGADAAELAERVNANAFTYDNDIVFNQGQYQPHTSAGESLLAHELAHVAQQREAKRLQRQPKPGATPTTQTRQDVVVIVGRPSMTIPKNETAEEKEQMVTWQSAARALSPHVFEGLTVDKAFAGLKKFNQPIGKLYIIAHADSSGIGEVAADGSGVSTTTADLTKRISQATGLLGNRKPDSVEMLSCFGGGSPKTMGKIGKSLGATSIRAPVQMTVVSGQIIKINGKPLTKQQIANSSDEKLSGYIKQTTALKYYDFVPGVPHPKTPPSASDKMTELIKVLRTTGMIPYVGYNSAPGERDAVPYWKAPVEQRKPSEELSIDDEMRMKGLIEVQLGTTTQP